MKTMNYMVDEFLALNDENRKKLQLGVLRSDQVNGVQSFGDAGANSLIWIPPNHFLKLIFQFNFLIGCPPSK